MAKNNKELTEEELVKRNKEQLAKAKEINSKQKENFEQLPSANTEEGENYFLNDYEKNRNKIYKVKSNVEDSQKYVSEEEQNREIDYNNPDDGLILDIKDPFKLDKEYIEHLISAKDETVKLQKKGTNFASWSYVLLVVWVFIVVATGMLFLNMILVAIGLAASIFVGIFSVGAPLLIILGLILLIIRIFGKAARVDNENELEGLKYYLAKLESNSYTYLGKPASEITFEYKKEVILDKIKQMNISYEDIIKTPELSCLKKYLSIDEEKYNEVERRIQEENRKEQEDEKKFQITKIFVGLLVTGGIIVALYLDTVKNGGGEKAVPFLAVGIIFIVVGLFGLIYKLIYK